MVGVPFPQYEYELNRRLVRFNARTGACLNSGVRRVLSNLFPGRISSLYGSFAERSQPGSDSCTRCINGSDKDGVSASEE